MQCGLRGGVVRENLRPVQVPPRQSTDAVIRAYREKFLENKGAQKLDVLRYVSLWIYQFEQVLGPAVFDATERVAFYGVMCLFMWCGVHILMAKL